MAKRKINKNRAFLMLIGDFLYIAYPEGQQVYVCFPEDSEWKVAALPREYLVASILNDYYQHDFLDYL